MTDDPFDPKDTTLTLEQALQALREAMDFDDTAKEYVHTMSGRMAAAMLDSAEKNFGDRPKPLQLDLALNAALHAVCRLAVGPVLGGDGIPPMQLADELGESIRVNLPIYVEQFLSSENGQAYLKAKEAATVKAN